MTAALDNFICFGGFIVAFVVMIVRAHRSPRPPASTRHPPHDRRVQRRKKQRDDDHESDDDDDGEARYPDEDFFLFEHFRNKR